MVGYVTCLAVPLLMREAACVLPLVFQNSLVMKALTHCPFTLMREQRLLVIVYHTRSCIINPP